MKTFYTILLLLITFFVKGQNLVPNWSFEDTLACPWGGTIGETSNWTSCGDTPDYFSTCLPQGSSFSVPTNWGGFQQPSTGNCYAAFGTYAPSNPDVREFIIAQLISPLNIGTKYFVSFKVCLSYSDYIRAYIATNKTGAKFTMNSYDAWNPPPLNNFSQIYTDSIIVDTVNWTTISGSFVADSAYQYIILGNFFDDLHTDKIEFVDTTLSFAYYYIDDVCVSTDSLSCLQPTNIINNTVQSNNCKIYPNPIRGKATIDFKNPSKSNSILNIYNDQGVLVKTLGNFTTSKIEIDTSMFPSGLYYFNIRTADGHIYSHRLVVE